MPLLKDGAEIENTWLFLDQDGEAELKPDQAVTLPLARFLELAEGFLEEPVLEGVFARLPPAEEMDREELSGLMERLEGEMPLYSLLADRLFALVEERIDALGLHPLQAATLRKRNRRWKRD